MSILGLAFAFASMNNFQLINLESPMPEDINDPELMNKQNEWLKKVSDFISHYGIITYYGYVLAAILCVAFHGVWLFAPEVINGHSREYWAFTCSGGLFVLAGFITELTRRNINS